MSIIDFQTDYERRCNDFRCQAQSCQIELDPPEGVDDDAWGEPGVCGPACAWEVWAEGLNGQAQVLALQQVELIRSLDVLKARGERKGDVYRFGLAACEIVNEALERDGLFGPDF